MSRYKTDPIVMRRVRQVIYDTGMYNKRLAQALGLNVNTISSWINGRTDIGGLDLAAFKEDDEE